VLSVLNELDKKITKRVFGLDMPVMAVSSYVALLLNETKKVVGW
jgi:hypothetical protein